MEATPSRTRREPKRRAPWTSTDARTREPTQAAPSGRAPRRGPRSQRPPLLGAALLPLVGLGACASGAPLPEPTPTSSAPAAPLPPVHELADALAACPFVGSVFDGRLERLADAPTTMRLLGPEGPCTPTFDEGEVADAPVRGLLHHRITGGCPERVSIFAFGPCDVLEGLRYVALDDTTQTLAPGKLPTDPRAAELASRPVEIEGLEPDQITRRVRVATADTGVAVLEQIEVVSFDADADPCAGREQLEEVIYMRPSGAEVTEAVRVETVGRPVGVFADREGRLVALETRVWSNRPGDRCEHGGWDCHRAAIESAPGPEPAKVLRTLDYGFAGNLVHHDNSSPALPSRACIETGHGY